MATVPYKMDPTTLTAALTALVAAPAGNYITTKKVTVTNTSAAAVTLTANKVPSGGSAVSGNVVLAALTIPANTVNGGIKEIYELENQILAPGDALYFSASTAGVLNLSVAGIAQTT